MFGISQNQISNKLAWQYVDLPISSVIILGSSWYFRRFCDIREVIIGVWLVYESCECGHSAGRGICCLIGINNLTTSNRQRYVTQRSVTPAIFQYFEQRNDLPHDRQFIFGASNFEFSTHTFHCFRIHSADNHNIMYLFSNPRETGLDYSQFLVLVSTLG